MSGPEILKISWSQLRVWDECHQKTLLKRQGKKNPAQDIRNFFHGTVADRIMRDWLNSPDLKPGQMIEMVAETTAREEQSAKDTNDGVVRWRNASDRQVLHDFVTELVTKLEPILRQLVLPYEYEPAKRFKAPVEIPYIDGSTALIYLTGEMDILTRDKPRDQWAVWDLKATKDNAYWRKTVGQLVFYDLATSALYGKPTSITGLIQPLCDREVMPLRVTDRQREILMTKIVAMAHGTWRRDFSLAETTGPCGWCEVKHACPRFDPVGDYAARLTGGSPAPTLESLASLSVG